MTVEEPLQTEGGAAHTLKLPRKRLDLAALTYAKKYRNFGWKAGALQAFEELEKAGLGRVEAITTKSGKVYVCKVFCLVITWILCISPPFSCKPCPLSTPSQTHVH